jgi:hypothetical protein
MEGYMWACSYLITKSGKPLIDGTPGKIYLTREEAESAALSAAKTFIDQCKLDQDPLLS